MKVLVTNGKIGLTAARLLDQKGVETLLLVRKKSDRDLGNIKEVVADATKPESLSSIFEGVDQFFFVSPLVKNMVDMAENLIGAAKDANVEHIVRCSARGASIEAPVTMGRLHGQVDQIIKTSNVPYTIIQPASFYQNIFESLQSIQRENAIYGATGDGKNAYIDVRDIAAVGVASILEPNHTNKTYVVTGGEVISTGEMAEELSLQLRRKIGYIDMPSEKLNQAYLSYGLSPWLANALIELSDITRKGYLASSTDDVEKVLGRKPITFKQFVTDNLKRFQGS